MGRLTFRSGMLDSFGPDSMDPSGASRPWNGVSGRKRGEIHARIRDESPRRPGVYAMLDEDGEILYVGKSKLLRARLLSYFVDQDPRSKARRLIAATRSIVWEIAASEYAALFRELELIRRFRPRFNVLGQPSRQRLVYLALDFRDAGTVTLLAQIPKPDPNRRIEVFGPMRGQFRATVALKHFLDVFQLRDCPTKQAMHFREDARLFDLPPNPGCLRWDFGICLGPCAGACTRQQYKRQWTRARKFLRGIGSEEVLEEMEQAMRLAGERQAFEEAAVLRDRLSALRFLDRQLHRLREANAEGNRVYARPAVDDPAEPWYLLRGGILVGVIPAPRCAVSARMVADRLVAFRDQPLSELPATAPDEMDRLLLSLAWFRRFPEECRYLRTPAEAISHCRRWWKGATA